MTLVLAASAERSAAQSRAVERAAAWLCVCVSGFAATLKAEKASAETLEWQRHAHALGLQISGLKLERGTAPLATGQPPLGAVLSHEEALTQRILDYVHAHYEHPMSLGEMASAFGLSVSHLSTVFHRATGARFHDYLDRIRLERAIELLAEPRSSIADVAARAGYASDTWFRHASLDKQLSLNISLQHQQLNAMNRTWNACVWSRKAIRSAAVVLAAIASVPWVLAQSIWTGTYDGHDYKAVLVGSTGLTWTEAEAAAEAFGPGWSLAAVTSAAENDFVFSLVEGKPEFWLLDPATQVVSGPWLGGYRSPACTVGGAFPAGENWNPSSAVSAATGCQALTRIILSAAKPQPKCATTDGLCGMRLLSKRREIDREWYTPSVHRAVRLSKRTATRVRKVKPRQVRGMEKCNTLFG